MFVKSGIIGLILFFSCVNSYAVGDGDKENEKPLLPQKRDRTSSTDPRGTVKKIKLSKKKSVQTEAHQILKAVKTEKKAKKVKTRIIREDVTTEAINFSSDAKWQTCFTPQQKCADFLVSILNEAKSTIYLQAYVLSSQPIADALVDAHNRKVEVKVLVDNSQFFVSYSKISFLSTNGVPVYIDVNATLAHNKVIVIDGETTITGSYNLSNAAEKRNIENLIVIKDSNVARSYLNNYVERYKDCSRYDNTNPFVVDLKESPTRLKSIARIKGGFLGDDLDF
jgi:phosphatidylserine/phosphatidylglycerophosphate/cardiolipin synthase-like enzyme